MTHFHKNNFDNSFSFTFDKKYFVVGSKYSIDKIKDLKNFLFFYMKVYLWKNV